MCEGHYWNDVRGTSGAWFTPGPHLDSVDVTNIVNGNVKVEKISPNNLPHHSVQEECQELGAIKVCDSENKFNVDEMIRRNKLEFDPNRVYPDGYDSDDSDLLVVNDDELYFSQSEEED